MGAEAKGDKSKIAEVRDVRVKGDTSGSGGASERVLLLLGILDVVLGSLVKLGRQESFQPFD